MSLKFEVSTKTPTLGSKEGVFQKNFELNSDFPTFLVEASPNVESERRATKWDSGEEHVSEPGSGEAEGEKVDEDIDVQPPRPAVFRGAFLLVVE